MAQKKGRLIIFVVAVIVVLLVAGAGYQLYQLNEIKNNIHIGNPAVANVQLGAPLPVVNVPSTIVFDSVIPVTNPTPYTLDVEKITYDIKINDEALASAAKENIKIVPVSTDISMPVNITLSSLSQSTLASIAAGSAQLKISGTIDVPIKLFGIVNLYTFSQPFSATQPFSALYNAVKG